MNADILTSFQELAERLSGQSLVVRFRDPPIKGAFGECYRLDNGVLVVDVKVGPILGMFDTLLHETAHAKLHHDIAPVTSNENVKSGAIDLPDAGVPHFENPAKKQVDKWMDYLHRATGYLGPECNDYGRVQAYLRELKNYRE